MVGPNHEYYHMVAKVSLITVMLAHARTNRIGGRLLWCFVDELSERSWTSFVCVPADVVENKRSVTKFFNSFVYIQSLNDWHIY